MRPFFLAIIATSLVLTSAYGDSPAPVGQKIANFILPDMTTNQEWNLADASRSAKATVIVFTSVGCPVSNAYLPRLGEYHKRFAKNGVTFVAINSHPAEEPSDIRKSVAEAKLPFATLKDQEGSLAAKLSITRVPAVLVLDSGRTVRYAGRIDDQFSPGVHRVSASTRELVNAIDAVLEGRDVSVKHTVAAGCKLRTESRVEAASNRVTYHKEVSRILQEKCQGCHRPGEAAPFSLLDYKSAKGWSAMIREVVADGIMPPWHADAPRGYLANDRRLTDEQKATLITWIDAGCPEGDSQDAPAALKYQTGWRLGREPDVVLKMNREVKVPAQYLMGLAGMPYQYIPVGEPFAEDTWVQAVEVRPDFREALHHVIAFIIPPGKTMYDVAGPDFSKHILAAYVPGDNPIIYPEGTAKKIAKGSKILFEMHYTPMGKAGIDRSCIGLIYAKSPPKWEAKGDAVFFEGFTIPPHEPNYKVTASKTFSKPQTLVALTPHMHLRGKAFKYEMITPDNKSTVLLNVPKYDFNWQVAYVLSKPVEMPAGSKIICTAWYDNSKGNPFNPDPSKKVFWGEQTWEEMMIGFIETIEAR